MRRRSPFVALAEGLLAGAVGAGIQTLFFGATRKLAPKPPQDAFRPPEPQQRQESETETVARRAARLAQRTLDDDDKKLGGQLVHYSFGAGWGGLFGLVRAAWPRARHPLGVGAFAVTAWAVSDNLILPAFRLSAWPQHYPPKTHAYALAAHLAYGAGVAATMTILERAPWLGALALAAIARRRHPIMARVRELRAKMNEVGHDVSRGAHVAFGRN